MALLNYQQINVLGAAKTYAAAAAGGDTVTPDDRGFLHIKNGATASSVTVAVPGSEYGQARPDVTVALPANSDVMVGPMVADLADPADGQVHVTYANVTTVTVAAVRA
ncbi:MAG: hypothetical protein HOV66_28040 [Streptomycetaceae bacterium]|nr:hypothetical protein [Streptomycetaceae bacterium]